VVARPQRSAPGALCPAGPVRPDRADLLDLYAQVQNEHVWQTAWADIIHSGMAPQAASEKAFKRIEEIFSKYPITQS